MKHEWDLEKLTLQDILVLSGGADTKSAFEIIARCAKGGAASIPALHIREAFEDFMRSYTEAINPKAKDAASAKE